MRSSNPLDRARDAFRKAVNKAQINSREHATVGWRKSATNVIIDVPGRRNYIYVTKSADQTVTVALNRANVPRQAFLPVWVVLENDTHVVIGRDNSNAGVLSSVPDSDYGMTPHPLGSHSDTQFTEPYTDGYAVTWDGDEGAFVLAPAGALVESVNGLSGTVVLDADDIDDAATTHKFASAAELAAIATAVQPGDLAAVATSGSFDDLSDGTTNKAFTDTEKTKLAGIATGANNYSHPNHTGEVTSSGDGATTIANNAVTNAKAADMAQSTIKGRAAAAGTGDPTDLSASQVRTLINVADGADNTATALDGAAADTPADAHTFVYVGTGVLKSISWANIKATLKTYFDTLYAALNGFKGARVYNNANISIADSTFTVLTFNSERYDTNSYHSTSSNTGRLTVPAAGKYLIIGQIAFAGGAGVRGVQIRLNGTTTLASNFVNPVTGASTDLIVVTEYELAASDYVELVVYQNSGGAINVLLGANYSPEFMISLRNSP